MPDRLQTLTLYSAPLSMYGAKAHIAVAARPAVQPTLLLMTQTLTRQGRPVPQFMSDALAVAT
jgi:hypothetical protein